MNEKIKKVFIAIGSFLLGIIAFIFGRKVRNHTDTITGVKSNIQSARESIEESEDRIESSIKQNQDTRESIEQCLTDTEKLESSTKRARDILGQIKKQPIKE